RGRGYQLDLEGVVVDGAHAQRVHVRPAGVDALGAFDDVDAVRHRRGRGRVGDAAERVDVIVGRDGRAVRPGPALADGEGVGESVIRDRPRLGSRRFRLAGDGV